jgi:hypothetical protein
MVGGDREGHLGHGQEQFGGFQARHPLQVQSGV